MLEKRVSKNVGMNELDLNRPKRRFGWLVDRSKVKKSENKSRASIEPRSHREMWESLSEALLEHAQ